MLWEITSIDDFAMVGRDWKSANLGKLVLRLNFTLGKKSVQNK